MTRESSRERSIGELLTGESNSSSDARDNITNELVDYAFTQALGGLLISLFSAIILFIALFNPSDKTLLWNWFGVFAAILVIRFSIVVTYKVTRPHFSGEKWYTLFVVSAVLGGLAWACLAVTVFPHATMANQTLYILIMAGVTAGAVSTFSAILPALILFVALTLLPLIVEMLLLRGNDFALLDIAIIGFMIYIMYQSFRTHKIILNTLNLKSQNLAMLANLEYLSTHDSLTKLDNRWLFTLNLNNAIARAKRADNLIALLYMDLDNFKEVNDTYGHQIGDQVLIRLGALVRETIRESDLLARLGGDEFAVIEQDFVSIENTKLLATRICEALSKPLFVDKFTIKLSASIGISLYPNDGSDAETLINKADNAMYHAKADGKNRYCFSFYKKNETEDE